LAFTGLCGDISRKIGNLRNVIVVISVLYSSPKRGKFGGGGEEKKKRQRYPNTYSRTIISFGGETNHITEWSTVLRKKPIVA
jgi:hypothetical protein